MFPRLKKSDSNCSDQARERKDVHSQVDIQIHSQSSSCPSVTMDDDDDHNDDGDFSCKTMSNGLARKFNKELGTLNTCLLSKAFNQKENNKKR